MPNNPIHEMISAYAVGCMDKDNFVQFKDYMNEGGELPEGELGEMQNIVAMIPIILDFELPDPAIKDKVAKKLISMKDEIKTKIREERRKTFTTGTKATRAIDKSKTGFKKSFDSGMESEKATYQFPEKSFRTTAKFEVPDQLKNETAKELLSTNVLTAEQPQSLFARPTHPEMMEDQKPSIQEKNSGGGMVGWIALLLTLVLFTVIGYFTYSSVDSVNKKTAELEAKIVSLRGELATSSSFINNYISLIEFFNYKDVSVITLEGTDQLDKGTARLFLAFNEKEGIIQFKNAKALQPNQGYQLWMVSKGQSYSMGVYSPVGSQYLRISAFPFVPKEQVENFKITIESNTGSPTPSIQNYMFGVFKK